MKCKDCGDTFPVGRAKLGYQVCLKCGDAAATEQRLGWCIAPLPKQGYTLITRKSDLLNLNQKTR